MNMPKDGNYISAASDAYDELKEKLSPELFKLHEKFAQALEADFCHEIDFFFVEGFKLGLLLGIECTEN